MENGSHRNQTGDFIEIPEGWAVIPDNIETPNFPFGEIKTNKIDLVQVYDYVDAYLVFKITKRMNVKVVFSDYQYHDELKGYKNRIYKTVLKKVDYKQIYLHTHRYLDSGLPFWKAQGFIVTVEEDDYDETTHMIKILD